MSTTEHQTRPLAEIGGLLALCVAFGETGPKLIGFLGGALLPEPMVRAVATPTLVGGLCLAAAARRRWNPFGSPSSHPMNILLVLLLGLCGVLSITAAAAGVVTLAKARLAEKLVYSSAVVPDTQCDGTESANATLVLDLPEDASNGTVEVCGTNPQVTVAFVVSHTGYIEERTTLDSDCERLDLVSDAQRFQATLCLRGRGVRSNAEPIRVFRATAGGKEVHARSRRQLRWYEKPAYFF